MRIIDSLERDMSVLEKRSGIVRLRSSFSTGALSKPIPFCSLGLAVGTLLTRPFFSLLLYFTYERYKRSFRGRIM